MRRTLYAIFGIISLTGSLLFVIPAMAMASNWDVSVKQSWVDGNADFWFHYPSPDPHVISQLHAPQKQSMTLFGAKYTFTNEKESYLKFGYGSTARGNKGRGFDADWANPDDYNQITDYGTMDFYGEQTNLSIDFGVKIFESNLSQTKAFVGWDQHKSTNELRNVIYYLYDKAYLIPPIVQEDIGAFYDMDFKGYRVGLEHTQQVGTKLSFTGIASLGYITTNLYGEWTNHSPRWVFKDSGHTVGYELGLDVKYNISKIFGVNLGYSYYYGKPEDCTRMMDTGNGYEKINQLVDLELAQQGYYFGVFARF